MGAQILSRDPWVLTLDNFFDAEEAAALVGQVSGGFERSTDTGAYDKVTTSNRRRACARPPHPFPHPGDEMDRGG